MCCLKKESFWLTLAQRQWDGSKVFTIQFILMARSSHPSMYINMNLIPFCMFYENRQKPDDLCQYQPSTMNKSAHLQGEGRQRKFPNKTNQPVNRELSAAVVVRHKSFIHHYLVCSWSHNLWICVPWGWTACSNSNFLKSDNRKISVTFTYSEKKG